MIVLEPPYGRRVGRRVISSILDAGLATVPFIFNYLTRPSHYLSTWVQIGLPFVIFVAVRFVGLTLWSPAPEISWDRERLHVRWPDELVEIPWSEFAGYRFTWDLPRRLKIFHTSRKKAVIIDIGAFDDQQREMFITELTAHSPALPNTRLKLAARVPNEIQ